MPTTKKGSTTKAASAAKTTKTAKSTAKTAPAAAAAVAEAPKPVEKVIQESPLTATDNAIGNIVPPDSEFGILLVECNGSSEDALFKYCFLHNICYSRVLARRALIRAVESATDEDGADAPQVDIPEIYQNEVAADVGFAGRDFFSQLKRENFERIYEEQQEIGGLDEETAKNRMSVIEILAYDPFADDAKEDRPQLYRDMAAMLTEGMRKDVAKAKAALSIVRGYSNLEKYQRKINELMQVAAIDDASQKTLDQLIKVQKTLQDSINQTAERNNFTVKGIGTSGQGMLSDVMNRISDYGIDEGVVNFYDIATSRAIEEVANLSFKAQLNQVNLSKTDYADILSQQAQMVKEAQARARDALEGLRLAKEKIKKQRLLDELAKDYRKKGISEKEIEAFINREYRLYDVD